MGKEKSDEKFWIEYFQENVMLSKDAKEYLEMSTPAFTQAIQNKRLRPFYEHGEGVGVVRFFHKEDVMRYKVEKDAKRAQISAGEKRNRKQGEVEENGEER